jgi:1-acyl-sn-glycerol-3-phosphate acyltransferase
MLRRALIRTLGRSLPRDLAIRDAGHGYDTFGARAEWVRAGALIAAPLYRTWFRVRSTGHDHLPASSGAIVVANHGGTLPFDAAMLWMDVLVHENGRLLRPIGDHFISGLPFVGSALARMGVVAGSRANVSYLLRQNELVLIFPEGVSGIGKPFRDRYRIQTWSVGHAELAIRHRVPIVPVAVIGAEEQMPEIARLPVRVLGLPYVPLALTPFPLPVHYHVLYGEPLRPADRYDPKEADDPDVLERVASESRRAVESLIARGLDARAGVFR